MTLLAYLDPGDGSTLFTQAVSFAFLFLLVVVAIAVVFWAVRSIRKRDDAVMLVVPLRRETE